MQLLKVKHLWKLGRWVALLGGWAGASCTSTVQKSALGGDGIALAKAVEGDAMGGTAGEEFDSQAAGFLAEVTPGSQVGEEVRWVDESLPFWQASRGGLFPISAGAEVSLWGDDEVPVYRSISEFRRPEGIPFTAEEFERVEGDGAVGEEEKTVADEVEEPAGEGVLESVTTAERGVQRAVLTPIAPAGEVSGADDAETPIHVVKVGESLWRISRMYGTTVGEIKRLNGLESDEISPGMELKVPKR